MAVENKELSEKLVLAERKLEEYTFQLKKQQTTMEQLETEMRNKEHDVQRKKDAVYSSNAELSRCKD